MIALLQKQKSRDRQLAWIALRFSCSKQHKLLKKKKNELAVLHFYLSRISQ